MSFREQLVCPECRAPLAMQLNGGACPNGHEGYVWDGERAVFPIGRFDRSRDNQFNQGILSRLSGHPVLLKMLSAAMSVDILYKTKKSRTRLSRLSSSFSGKQALNVGSGSTDFGPHIVNLDIGPFPHVNVVASSDRLPFPDGHFDLVISQAVLEHVADPHAAVKEMIRVLKPGGELYAEIPFIQGFHPTPGDYQRFTISGIEQLFPDLSRIEKGVVNGPASALSWILREFLSILFSFNSQTLYKVGLVVFSWVVWPIKFFDCFLEGSRFAHIIASGLFFHGKKESIRQSV